MVLQFPQKKIYKNVIGWQKLEFENINYQERDKVSKGNNFIFSQKRKCIKMKQDVAARV